MFLIFIGLLNYSFVCLFIYLFNSFFSNGTMRTCAALMGMYFFIYFLFLFI